MVIYSRSCGNWFVPFQLMDVRTVRLGDDYANMVSPRIKRGSLLRLIRVAIIGANEFSGQMVQHSLCARFRPPRGLSVFYRRRVPGRYRRLGVDCPLYHEWHLMSAFRPKRTCASALQMSASGVKRTCLIALHMSALPTKADLPIAQHSAYDPKRTSSDAAFRENKTSTAQFPAGTTTILPRALRSVSSRIASTLRSRGNR